MKTIALLLFIAVYAIMIFRPKLRMWSALIGAGAFVLLGIVPFSSLLRTIDFNVLLMISGMMLLVSYFSLSGMPLRIADALLDCSKNLCMVIVLLSLFAGAISAFIDNVATVLMLAPVAVAVAKKLNASPIPMIISIAVSSNLQGAATLVGDTTSIMLGAYADMNFAEFFFMGGKPGMFWAVELGAAATVPVMLFLFRTFRQPVQAKERAEVKSYLPSFALAAAIVTLIAASFLENRPALTNGIICMSYALLCVAGSFVRRRGGGEWRTALKEYDWQTVLLLLSLFIVVAGITNVGIIDDIAGFFVRIGGHNLFLLYSLVVWGSVLISAFVDNIPYVSAMLPVISGVAAMMGVSPYLLYFGLLCGATLGGNLTPIGASANITGIGILRRNGFEVRTRDFMRISVPFTLTAVTAGYLFLWFVWA
ncbi:SLC13 family permease [Lachnoclostridium sp. Marseille-P6806]|uniref:SLC13 family permease n=1 Tax=Lachnoclostridium sp. Marseille-P6806 TaxID=2364793 RepID=UPI001030CB5D|nr:SLC13 family permease [Lachnoclostridium sp. Marseille-P6806]